MVQTSGPHEYYHTPDDTIDTIDPYELGDVPWEPVLEPLRVTSVVFWEDAGGRHQVALPTLRLAEEAGVFGSDGFENPTEQQSRKDAAGP